MGATALKAKLLVSYWQQAASNGSVRGQLSMSGRMGTLHIRKGAGLVLLLLVGAGNVVASDASTGAIACGK